jgi:hypothetical protein
VAKVDSIGRLAPDLVEAGMIDRVNGQAEID